MKYISVGMEAEEEKYLDELNGLLEEILNIDLQQIVLSNTRDEAQGTKVKVRPVLLKGDLVFQETLYRGTQVFHENCNRNTIKEHIVDYLGRLFKQGEFMGDKLRATVLVSKKGKISVKTHRSPEKDIVVRQSST